MISSQSLLMPALIAAGLALTAPSAAAEAPEAELGALIQQGLREAGPFFTAEEQAVIDRACGYAPDEWDGFELNMHGEILHCANGRDVDDPQVRRVLRQAGPRIGRRVSAVMARADVRQAIERITEAATDRAMRELARHGY